MEILKTILDYIKKFFDVVAKIVEYLVYILAAWRAIGGAILLAFLISIFTGSIGFWITLIICMGVLWREGAFTPEGYARREVINAEEAQVRASKANNNGSFLSRMGKNLVAGAAVGKALSGGMSKPVGKRHFRCGWCQYETISSAKPSSCPKCGKYGSNLFIEL